VGYSSDVTAAESDFDLIFAALEKGRIRYLVVGGVAVVLHGVPRFTADLDLVLDLVPANVTAALQALGGLGYRPRAPVGLYDFADAEKRRDWIQQKSLTVLGLWSPNHPATEIDLFVDEPLPFEAAWARACHIDLGANSIRVASIEDLIQLKRRAGRPQDHEDIARLNMILAESENG
jgi:hypothetical protein